ncbi:MAG: SMI1/KNR4 family protein, partial [Alphaproteobacteria bacterium]
LTGVVWLNLENRVNFNQPAHLIEVDSVGEGTTYCLDTSQMNESGECPVVAWPLGGYEETPVLEIVSEDFGKFFLDRVEEQIALKTEQTR